MLLLSGAKVKATRPSPLGVQRRSMVLSVETFVRVSAREMTSGELREVASVFGLA